MSISDEPIPPTNQELYQSLLGKDAQRGQCDGCKTDILPHARLDKTSGKTKYLIETEVVGFKLCITCTSLYHSSPEFRRDFELGQVRNPEHY